MLKLVQLKYFVTAVEAGSVTTAAKNLFISQPALSKQLSQLERELNCELFLRKTTGIELTAAGKHLYHKAVELLIVSDQLLQDMNTFSDSRRIKIGALPSIASNFLPAIVSRLSTEYKVELIIKDTTDELVSLMEGDLVDFVFVQDASNKRNFLMETLFWEPYDAIIPLNSYLSEKKHLSITEFAANKLILHKNPCDIRKSFETYCKSNKVNYEMAMELESNESIIPFVKNGLGSSIVPRMVSQNISEGSISIKILEDEKLRRSIDFFYKQSNKKLAKTLLSFCENYSGG